MIRHEGVLEEDRQRQTKERLLETQHEKLIRQARHVLDTKGELKTIDFSKESEHLLEEVFDVPRPNETFKEMSLGRKLASVVGIKMDEISRLPSYVLSYRKTPNLHLTAKDGTSKLSFYLKEFPNYSSEGPAFLIMGTSVDVSFIFNQGYVTRQRPSKLPYDVGELAGPQDIRDIDSMLKAADKILPDIEQPPGEYPSIKRRMGGQVIDLYLAFKNEI